MKKRIVAMMLVLLLGLSVVACGKTEEKKDTSGETKEETTQETGLSEDEKNAVLTEYVDGLTNLVGTEFKMYAQYDQEVGFTSKLEGGSGRLATVKLNEDVIVEGDCENNKLTLYTIKVDEDGEFEKCAALELNDFFVLADETNIKISSTTLPNGKNVLIIESANHAYTYADGSEYFLYVVEQKEDGTLELAFDKRIAGSADEDITADIRNGFNKCTGFDFSQEEFEKAFYNNELLTEQSDWTVYTMITFKSETAKVAEESEDWDKIGEMTGKLYENQNEDILWGEGAFEEAQ